MCDTASRNASMNRSGPGTFLKGRGRALVLCALAASLSLVSSQGLAQNNIKPQVMLLLDTSGSMEWGDDANNDPTQGLATSNAYCAAYSTVQSGGPPAETPTMKRSKWNLLLDVLLGPIIKNYKCTVVPPNGRKEWSTVYQPDIPHFSEATYTDTNGTVYNIRDTSKGILNKYREQMRFGLMTIDIGLNPNPDLSGFFSYPITDPTHDTTHKHYCPTDTAPSTNGECPMVNIGVRNKNPDAGQLIPVGNETTMSAEESNAKIQTQLRNIEPFGCSPLGAAINDLGYYFTYEKDVTTDDPYAACRNRFTILLTDGRPSQGQEFPAGCDATSNHKNPVCPWQSSFDEAMKVFKLNVKTIVIGFKVPKSSEPRDFLLKLGGCAWPGTTDQDAAPWADPKWSGVMCDGGIPPTQGHCKEVCDCKTFPTPAAQDCPNKGYALFADNTEQLLQVFDLVFNAISNFANTWSVPATTVRTYNWQNYMSSMSKSEFARQYEFYTSFLPGAGVPWKGYLDRKTLVCNQGKKIAADGGSDAAAVSGIRYDQSKDTDFAQALTIQALKSSGAIDRKIFSSKLLQADASPTLLEFTAQNENFNDCDIGMAENQSQCGLSHPTENNDVQALELHLRGGCSTSGGCSRRRDWPLASSYHASPIILDPANRDIPIPSYNVWRKTPLPSGAWSPSNRPPQVFMATNEGVLHSFNGWYEPGTSSDDVRYTAEWWGYVPMTLLHQIAEQFPMPHNNEDFALGSYQFIWGIDATPVAKDVRYRRNLGQDDSPQQWGSVLVGGFRQGHRGYYALDVRDPKPKAGTSNPSPKVLWEIDNLKPGFEEMGETYGQAGLTYYYGRCRACNQGALAEIAVAILPAGYIKVTEPPSQENLDTDLTEQSRGVYIVELDTGKLLKYLDPDKESDLCGTQSTDWTDPHTGKQYETQIIGTPSIPFGAVPLKIAGEAYLGDDRGRIWRVDITGKDWEKPKNLGGFCIEMVYDTLIDEDFKVNGKQVFFQPIVNPVTISYDSQRNNVLLFGTGQLSDSEAMDHNRIFSVSVSQPKLPLSGCNGSMNANRKLYHNWKGDRCIKTNWWLGEWLPGMSNPGCPTSGSLPDGGEPDSGNPDASTGAWANTLMPPANFLHPGEKLFGTPVVFAETAYFVTYMPLIKADPNPPFPFDGACAGGHSRIWALHYTSIDPAADGQSTACNSWHFDDTGIPEECQTKFSPCKWAKGEDEFGRLVPDIRHPQYQRFKWYEHTFIPGLRLIRRPACYGDAFPGLCQQNTTTYQLVAQGVVKEGAKTPVNVTQIALTIQSPVRSFKFDSWARVFSGPFSLGQCSP